MKFLKNLFKFPPTILWVLIVCLTCISPVSVSAGVDDNIAGASFELLVGQPETPDEPSTLFSWFRKVWSQLSKLDVLQSQMNTVVADTTKLDSIPTDFDNATLVEKVNYIQYEMKNMLQENNKGSACSLFVYLPCNDALVDYEESEVTLISPSGNQNSTGKLIRGSGAYSAILNFDFSGDCTLKWTAKNLQGSSFNLVECVRIERSSQEFRLGSTTHRLNLRIPKENALTSYTGKSVALEYDGSDEETVFGEDGDGYYTTIYSDFTGDANLSYNYLDDEGGVVPMLEPVRLNTEIIDLEIGIADVDPAMLSWRTVKNICASGRAQLFLRPGDILYGGGTTEWYVVDVKPNAIKVWNNNISLGKTWYEAAEKAAEEYWRTWNEKNVNFGITACGSDLLSVADANAIPQSKRAGCTWWLRKVSNYYYYICYNVSYPQQHGSIQSTTDTSTIWETVHYGNGWSSSQTTPFVRPGLWFGELPPKRPMSVDYTVDEISTLCGLGIADDYGLCEVGTELFDGWCVIEHKKDGVKDQLKLWKKESVGSGNWGTVNTLASSYFTEFNSSYDTNCAISSGLLTKDDVENAWFVQNRNIGSNYWTASTGANSGEYWRVLQGGEVVSTTSRNENNCVPYIWIK